MSQSRESNEAFISALSDQKQNNERQKMIQELKNMKMYEEGMNDADMTDLLKVVQESQTMANLSSSRNITENEPREIGQPTPLSYSRALINKSPATPEQGETGPDGQLVRRNKSLSQEKHADSPNELSLTTDINKSPIKESKDAQAININKAHYTDISNSVERITENKQMNHRENSLMRQEDKIPKWTINPLDASTNQNDQRLTAHYHSIDNEGRTEDSGGANASDNVDNAVTRLSDHLQLIAEMWHNHRRHSVECNFEWGSAIKVNETNASWNRKIIADDESTKPVEDANQSNETNFNAAESTHRHRKCTRTNSLFYDCINDRDNESDNRDEYFQMGSERETAAPKMIVASRSLRDKRVVESTVRSELDESTAIKKGQHAITAGAIVLSDDNAETGEETSDEPPNKLLRSTFEETASSVYPRRIIPPKWGGIESRRPLYYDDRTSELRVAKKTQQDDEKDQVGRVVEKRKHSFGHEDTEIAQALARDDDGDNDKDVITSNENTEIKPSRLSTRLKLGIERLTEAQEKEKEADASRREHERIKKDDINRDREERLRNRIRDEAEKMKREEASRIRKAQREEDWKAVSNCRSKGQSALRTQLFPDRLLQNSSDGPILNQTSRFVMCRENEGELITEDAYDVGHEPECVQCPICNKKFASQEIVAHAAMCEEFQDASSSDASRSNSMFVRAMGKPSGRKNASKFECEICGSFTTTNGKQFEEHVHYCTKDHRDSLTVSVVNRIIEVSTSPLRAVRPISEQTDSEIDYEGQFLSKTRSNTNAGKKRKR